MNRRQIKSPGADGTGKAQKQHAYDADINTIVNRHKPGQFIGDPRATRQPMFIDVPSESFHDSLNRVTQVRLQFSSLPARIRSMFANDPFHLLAFIEKPENRPRALKLGLVVPTDEEAAALSLEAAKARRTEQIDLIREAAKPDPEAQPDYTPKGGKGGNAPKGA